MSVLSFIGSVCAPDKATLKTENHALQGTTAGPYNAITSSLLQVGSIQCDIEEIGVKPSSYSQSLKHSVYDSVEGIATPADSDLEDTPGTIGK